MSDSIHRANRPHRNVMRRSLGGRTRKRVRSTSSCSAEVTVRPGDVVRGDVRGPVVVPKEHLASVLTMIEAVADRETGWGQPIARGASLPAAAGIDDLINKLATDRARLGAERRTDRHAAWPRGLGFGVDDFGVRVWAGLMGGLGGNYGGSAPAAGTRSASSPAAWGSFDLIDTLENVLRDYLGLPSLPDTIPSALSQLRRRYEPFSSLRTA
jgi:hypothetical protein